MKEWIYIFGVFLFVFVCIFLIFSILSVPLPTTFATFVALEGIKVPFYAIFIIFLAIILSLVFLLIRILH